MALNRQWEQDRLEALIYPGLDLQYLYIEGDSWRESVDIRGGAPSEKNSRVKSYNSPLIINQLMQ